MWHECEMHTAFSNGSVKALALLVEVGVLLSQIGAAGVKAMMYHLRRVCYLPPWNLCFHTTCLVMKRCRAASNDESFVCFCSSLSLCFTQVCVIILSCKQLQAYANGSQFTCFYSLWIVTPVGVIQCQSVCFEGKSRPQFEAGRLWSVGHLNY